MQVRVGRFNMRVDVQLTETCADAAVMAGLMA